MNIKTIFSILFASVLLFTSCHNSSKESASDTSDTMVNQMSSIDTGLLIRSWKDQSKSALHFSLFSDGTAQSDNMKTLLYRHWILKNNQLYLIAESIGNGVSFVDTMVYDIEQLDENQLVLKQDDVTSTYKKESKSIVLEGAFIYGHEVRSFTPCGSDKQFWVLDKTEQLKNRYEELTANQDAYTPIFVEIEVVDQGKAEDGFAADYDGVYEVIKVLKIKESENNDCE